MKQGQGTFGAEALLLLTAAIWGFAFVAQRAGMDSIGPFAYSAVRYAIGGLALIPLLLYRRRSARRDPEAPKKTALRRFGYPLLAGGVLFLGNSFQQLGLVTTTAGNAAFITSLYVVLVPILGLFLGRRVSARGWAAALLAIVGLYIISVGGRFSVSPGDFLELAGSFFWACHIIIIGRLAGKTEAVELSVGQFLVCAALSLCASFLLDPPFPGGGWLPALRGAFIPIMYGGLLSSALAFTLQIVAQRTARPSHASIIMALEGLFGAIGGILILGEPLTWKLAAGGCLMLSGAILSQLEPPAPKPGVAAAEKKS